MVVRSSQTKCALLISVAFGGVLLLFSCEPSPDLLSKTKDMVVQTGFDKNTNFSTYSTYTMPLDTIGQIYNADPNDTIITGEYATFIAGTVKNNIDKTGYNLVAKNQSPDLGINVFIVRDYNVFQYTMYPGYYGYPGYYYPSYYGYSGYYSLPYVGYASTSTATLIIEILDLKSRDSQNRIKIVWRAFIGDVLTSQDSFQKSKEAVDQAFAQSSYIRK
jgi:hypothetical protein